MDFKGFGPTQKDAEADALKSACEELSKPTNLGWTPEPDFLREKNMVRFGQPTEKDLEKSGHVYEVSMQLEVTPSRPARSRSRRDRTA